LLKIINKKIKDNSCLNLISQIITSFNKKSGKGLPLGNVTSQLFANIYLNELDKYLKENLWIKSYLRYNDDFVLIYKNEEYLEDAVEKIKEFLDKNLKLHLPRNKIILRKYSWGIDFLGYVIYPNYILPRKRNRKRLLRVIEKKIIDYKNQKISYDSFMGTVNSYLGLLKHANSYELSQKIEYLIYFNLYHAGEN